jgi:hypothetical protein
MAKKRKKDASSVAKTKLALQQHRNKFFKQVEFIMNTLAGEKVFHLLTPPFREILYRTRKTPFKVQFPPDISLRRKDTEFVEKALQFLLRRTSVRVSTLEMNLETWTTTWTTIAYFINTLPEEMNSHFPKLIEKLLPHTLNVQMAEEGTFEIDFALNFLSAYLSYGNKYVELVNPHYVPKEIKLKVWTQTVEFKLHQALVRKFIFNNETHIGQQFGALTIGTPFCWFTLELEQFNPRTAFGKLPVEIYIQNHALQRFAERMDCVDVLTKNLELHNLFNKPDVFSKDNKYFLSFKLKDQKVGYFVGKLIEGTFLIQTFLFLTNNGTPEGDKLNANLKLQKADKEFLKIDKLSSFAALNNTDIAELKDIFNGTGCEGLLNIQAVLPLNTISDETNKFLNNIKNYLTVEYNEESDLNYAENYFRMHTEPEYV